MLGEFFTGRIIRLSVAIVALGCLVVALMTLRANLSQHERELSQRVASIEWDVTQSILEAQRMEMALNAFEFGKARHDDVIVAAEVLWSRVGVAKASDVFEIEALSAAMAELEAFLEENESLIYDQPDALLAEIDNIRGFVGDWRANLRRTWLEQRRRSNDLIVEAANAWRHGNQQVLDWLIVGSVVGLVIYMAVEVVFAQRAQKKERKLKNEAMSANRAKSEFLANVSHEIRTPLNAIMGMAQLLAESGLPKDKAELVDVIEGSGRLLLATVNDVLDLSKIEARKMVIEALDFDLHQIIREAEKTHTLTAAKKGIELTVSLEPDVPRCVSGDPTRVRQVLNNLLSNAVKFTTDGSVRLSVCATESDQGGCEVCFKISDTGIGIDEHALTKIFEPFQQADTSTTRKHGGTGLGLAISRDLCRAMGGDLTVVSAFGEGSTFSACFHVAKGNDTAIAQQPAGDIDAPPSDPQSTVPAEPDLPSAVPSTRQVADFDRGATAGLARHLLLVDDSETNRMVISRFLKEHDIHITEAETGLEAVEAFAPGRFDIVLMDVQMPIMDGIEATRKIRAAEAADGREPVPIIAVTANVMAKQIEEYLRTGVDHVLAKPVSKAKLVALLRQFVPDEGGHNRPAA